MARSTDARPLAAEADPGPTVGVGVLRALERLEAASAARGEQRRAVYLRSQLRRMRRLVPDV